MDVFVAIFFNPVDVSVDRWYRKLLVLGRILSIFAPKLNLQCHTIPGMVITDFKDTTCVFRIYEYVHNIQCKT